MKKIGVLLGVLFLSACATATYPTNVPITQAVTVFGNIGPLASQEGYQVQSNGDRLHIAFDTATEIQYVADPEFTGGPNILIGVMVQDGKVPEHEVGARMQAASQKAYEWLKKATAVAAPAPASAPAVNVNIQVSASPVVVVPGSCQKLLDCHAALATVFCQAGGATCQFKIEISGMDDAACVEALPMVRMTVEPLSMGMPGFSMPVACQ
ncbi:MAG: hypothetical protein HOI23_04725 [Deltaproteobacteria bacterium]|jgi:hypothetical protein|nr:hypothetical protein [Deltaproteobacteria bacterium]MBT6435665.1 hypothetical protein [Deltaproteobacteria bacterium]